MAHQDLLPAEHLLDAGYVDAGQIVTSQEQQGIEIVGPVLADTSWQARVGQGFDGACFTIDWDHQTVTCPRGKVGRTWAEQHAAYDNPKIYVWFARADCRACPSRSRAERVLSS